MKPRRRKFARVFMVIALCAAVLFVALWARTAFYIDYYDWQTRTYDRNGRSWAFLGQTSHGTVALTVQLMRGQPMAASSITMPARESRSLSSQHWGQRIMSPKGVFAFMFRERDAFPGSPGTITAWDIQVPLWFPLLLSLGAAGLCYRLTRSRKAEGNLCPCPNCGYDTRANPSKCSECGQEIERSENTTTIEGDSTRPASTPSP